MDKRIEHFDTNHYNKRKNELPFIVASEDVPFKQKYKGYKYKYTAFPFKRRQC